MDNLERPLVSAQDETDDYERSHGVPPPQAYRQPAAPGAQTSFSTAGLPSQVGRAALLLRMGQRSKLGSVCACLRARVHRFLRRAPGCVPRSQPALPPARLPTHRRDPSDTPAGG